MTPEIEVVDLATRYRGFAAVREVSFPVNGGKIFGIPGRNGSGKMTTVGCLHGVMPTASGIDVALGFVVVALLFSTLGLLIGVIIPSSRAAQALGVLLWFAMPTVGRGGAGLPREMCTGTVGVVGDVTPLRHAIVVIQDGWLGLDPVLVAGCHRGHRGLRRRRAALPAGLRASWRV